MDGSAVPSLLGLLVLVGIGLSAGYVIGWFKYRRYGAEVDYAALGIGFLIAGTVALLVLLLTEGPWIVGVAFAGVGIVYLTRSRRAHGDGMDRAGPSDRAASPDATARTDGTGTAGRDRSRSRIEVGDRVLLTTDVELPRRDHDWQHETLPRGTEGIVLALIDDEDHDHESTGTTDMGLPVSVPAGLLVQAAGHEYGIRDFRFSAGQVVAKQAGTLAAGRDPDDVPRAPARPPDRARDT